MGAIELVADQWPVLFTKFDGEQTVADIEAYIREFAPFHARGLPWFGVSWLRKYSTAREPRVRIAAWMKDTEAQARAYCVANAMVTQSTGFRFVLSSILLLRPLVMPYTVTATMEDAFAFLRGHANKRNLALPAGLHSPWPDAP